MLLADGVPKQLQKGIREPKTNRLYVRLQSRLLFVVLYEEGQVFSPVVFKVPRKILIHVVLRDRDVQV